MSRCDPLSAALRATFGTSTELATATGCGSVSAWRYLTGRSVPPVSMLTRLMGRHRTIADAVLAMAGLDDATLDAEADRLRAELAELQADYDRLLAATGAAAPNATAGVGAGQGQAARPAHRVTP